MAGTKTNIESEEDPDLLKELEVQEGMEYSTVNNLGTIASLSPEESELAVSNVYRKDKITKRLKTETLTMLSNTKTGQRNSTSSSKNRASVLRSKIIQQKICSLEGVEPVRNIVRSKQKYSGLHSYNWKFFLLACNL